MSETQVQWKNDFTGKAVFNDFGRVDNRVPKIFKVPEKPLF